LHQPDIPDLINDVYCKTTFLKETVSTTQGLNDKTKFSLFGAQSRNNQFVVRTRQHQFCDLPLSQTPQRHTLGIAPNQEFGHRQHRISKPASVIVRGRK
jgi:hypothetical protein